MFTPDFVALSFTSAVCHTVIQNSLYPTQLKHVVQRWMAEQKLILLRKTELPSGVFGDGHSYSQSGGGHSLADWFHVNYWINAVWASHNATLWIRTEAAVVQTLVAMISATLLQRDSGGHTRDSNMNNQLANKGNNKNTKSELLKYYCPIAQMNHRISVPAPFTPYM